jgi:hypothetical protein
MRTRSLWVVVWAGALGAGGCGNKDVVNDLESRRDWRVSEALVSIYPSVVVRDAAPAGGGAAAGAASAGATSVRSLGEAPSSSGAGSASLSAAAARVSGRLTASRIEPAAFPAASATAATAAPRLTRVDGSGRAVAFVDGPHSLMTTPPPGQATPLADTKLFKDVMKACDAAIRERTSNRAAGSVAASATSGDTLSPRNAYEFARTTLGTLDLAAGYGAAAADTNAMSRIEALVDDPAAQATVPFDLVAQTYLKAYFQGKFVNRRGVKLAKPKIEAGKVDNATIAALETVLIEAYFDHRLGTDAPVPFKNKKEYVQKYLAFPADPFYVSGFEHKDVPQYLTDENAEPTATKFVGVRKLVDPAAWDDANPDSNPAPEGMSPDEYEVVRLLSSLNGEVKKQISALVFQIFGGVEFSFVFGGHFAIGDNETLATLVTTLIEVSAARSMEFKWTEFFRQFRYHHKTVGGKTVPFLSPADYTENARANGLDLPPAWQDGVLLLIRYHGLLAKVVGD